MVKNNKNKMTQIGNNIIKKIDKINEEFVNTTFLKTNNNNTIKTNKTKKSENKQAIIRIMISMLKKIITQVNIIQLFMGEKKLIK